MLLFDVPNLKNPVAHASHLGWAMAEPATLVYLPDIVGVVEVGVVIGGVGQVAEPLTMISLPGGHFVWAVQESVLVLRLKNPVAHALQRGFDPLGFLYLPGGHTADADLHWAVIIDIDFFGT